ncbi:hypothetical protein ABPG72_009235 [Tetrahymena utriculariae]
MSQKVNKDQTIEKEDNSIKIINHTNEQQEITQSLQQLQLNSASELSIQQIYGFQSKQNINNINYETQFQQQQNKQNQQQKQQNLIDQNGLQFMKEGLKYDKLQQQFCEQLSSQNSTLVPIKQQDINGTNAIPQLIIGNSQTAERKGILKNAQAVYLTDSSNSLSQPVSTKLYRNQKDIIQIDKLQHIQQINQQNQLRLKENSLLEANILAQNGLKGKDFNDFTVNHKIQKHILQQHLKGIQQNFCNKEGFKSNQQLQIKMNQYIQDKLAKLSDQIQSQGQQIDVINFQCNDHNFQSIHSSNLPNQNQDDEYEDVEEDIEEDEDDEILEGFDCEDEEEDDDEEEEDDEEEDIEEAIDKKQQNNNCLKSQANNKKFQFSYQMDIDGLRKKRIEMNKDQKNSTVIVNIKAQKKSYDNYDGGFSILNQKILNNQKQIINSVNDFLPKENTVINAFNQNISSIAKDGSLISQILKEKQIKKNSQQDIRIQQHQMQIQQQIESISNLYADALEFQRSKQINMQKLQYNNQQNLSYGIKDSFNSKINCLPHECIDQENSSSNKNQQNQQIDESRISNQNTQVSEQKIFKNNCSKIQFSPDVKNIFDQLEVLNYTEKKRATMVKEQEFNVEMQNMIDCVGCKESLHQFLNDLIQQANINQVTISFDGIYVNKNREIGILENFLENNFNIASFLQFHQNKQSMLENLNRNFNLFKKSIGSRNYRCNLHSKKPIPCLMKDNFEQLFDPDFSSKEEAIEIDESLFLSNLDKYLKKRKFCGTCKENILGEYQKLKKNIEIDQEEDQYLSEDYQNKINDESCNQCDNCDSQYHQELQIQENCMEEQNQTEFQQNQEQFHQKNDSASDKIKEVFYQNCANPQDNTYEHSQIEVDDDQEFEDEMEEDEEDEDEDEGDLDDEQYDLLNFIKYCHKTRKISIPMQVDFIQEIMSKAQVDTSLVKHANTTEAAQDELLICLGQTLKDRLQNVWKNKKSEEIVRQLFLNICYKIFMTQLQGQIQITMERNGCKNSLEEYLEEDEKTKEAKKLKNQKKKQKQKLKKQEKKQEELKKQMEEELKKKQEEEVKQKQKQETKLLKKKQEELQQQLKQIEEEQKKLKQQEQKKKKKNKKGNEIQSSCKSNEEAQDIAKQEGEQYAQAEPIEISKNKIAQVSVLKSQAAANIQLETNEKKQQQNGTNIDFENQQRRTQKVTDETNLQQQAEAEACFNQNQNAINAGVGQLDKQIKHKKMQKQNNLNNYQSKSSLPNQDSNSQNDNNSNSNIFWERERSFLKSLGWKEEQELVIEIPQIDIHNYSQNKNKYDKERANYRKTLHEQFLTVIKKQKNN